MKEQVDLLLTIVTKLKGLVFLGGIILAALLMIPEIVLWAKSCR